MLQQLKQFDADRLDLEELVSLAAYAKLLRAEYETLTLEVPAWLDDAARTLGRTIKVKVADEIEKRMAEARAQRSQLKTAQEKRDELDALLEKLSKERAALGV